ncbi:MAG: hypothetical protein FJX23_09085, partial [Alphaproteobacteria bacterium]|nr:hypothetical protein [Alphaproteobacteria bacterium]
MSAERKTTPYEQVAWGAYPDKIFASEKKSQRGKHGINFFSVFGILVGIILPIIFFLLLDFDWSPVLKYLFSVKGMIGLLPAFLFLAFMSLRTFGTQKFTALKYGQKWPIAAVGADGFLMARRGQLYQKRP